MRRLLYVRQPWMSNEFTPVFDHRLCASAWAHHRNGDGSGRRSYAGRQTHLAGGHLVDAYSGHHWPTTLPALWAEITARPCYVRSGQLPAITVSSAGKIT